jgi:hypothetical protein
MSRKYTNRLIELCEDGILTKEKIFDEMMSYFSEAEIAEFCKNAFAREISALFVDLEND